MSQGKIDMEQEAIKYLEKGFSIIPITGPAYTYGKDEDEKYRNSKKPLLKSWIEFQKRHPTKEEVKEWFLKWPDANIAIITGEISGVDVLDCDSKEATVKMGSLYKGTTPVAKNKKGGHLYFQHYPGMGCHNRFMQGEDFDLKAEGGYVIAPPSRIYGSDARYEWVRSAFDYAFDSLDSLSFFSFIYSINKNSSSQITNFVNFRQDSSGSSMWDYGKRDESLFHTANCLVKGGMPEDEIFQVLRPIVNGWGEDDPKWINAKIKSALDRSGKRERSMTQEVLEWLDSSNVVFNSSEFEKFVNIRHLADKKNVSQIFRRLAKEGIIERVGKHGNWRKIDKDIEFMDFVNVSKQGTIDLTLPLDIHKKTIFFPKNVIIVAGVTGYGKTSLILNIMRSNMEKFDWIYFMSEMSDLALNYKLNCFNWPIDAWKMKVVPDYVWDHNSIQDKIFPNAMNVIDYLEPEGDKPYGIHEIVTKIIKKLDKGMAIIAVQKKPNADLGTGGVYSAKAASLYLSLDWGTINIFKNRFREEDKQPLRTRRDFEIQAGQHFVAKGGWYDPNESKRNKKLAQVVDNDFIHEE